MDEKPWWYFTSPELGVLHTALKFGKQLRRVLAQDIDQHIEPTAVGHADDDFLGPVGTAALDHLRQHGNQAFAALQAEALGAGILGAQGLFQTLGLDQAAQQLQLHFPAVIRRRAHGLHPLHDPVTLLGIDDVHELGADRVAVGALQGVQDFTQGRIGLADVQAAGLEDRVEIGR